MGERKIELALAYGAEHLPKSAGSGAAILAHDMTGIAAKDRILA